MSKYKKSINISNDIQRYINTINQFPFELEGFHIIQLEQNLNPIIQIKLILEYEQEQNILMLVQLNYLKWLLVLFDFNHYIYDALYELDFYQALNQIKKTTKRSIQDGNEPN